MTTQITGPIGLGHQAAAFKLLHQMAVLYPDLPGAYVVVHDVFDVPGSVASLPAKINIQLDVQDFEDWRVKLGICPATVTLHATPSYTWVAADAVVHDVLVHLAGYLSTTLTSEQLEAPRVIEAAEVPA
ncbi:hypothetical protein ACFRIC_09130 [Streptomyces sp. NPDC056738]|uniref:hypothetical protein n=1 Tax=Streptomyces sp. NPDC056738 TaxID=3345933 RepID=UPI0036A638C6